MRPMQREKRNARNPARPQANVRGGGSSPREVAVLTVLVIGAAAVAAAAHWPVLSAEAISFDDTQYLFWNPNLQQPSLASAGRVITEVVDSSTVEGYYEPLTLLSLMLDVAAGGRPDNLAPFHRTSLALHVLNTALLVVLLYMLFGSPWPAAMVGLLFGTHPLTVEPVAWVWERKTLLAAFFALLCLALYVRYVRRGGRAPYLLCLTAYLLAVLSKPTSTPLPVLMLVLDFWPLRRLNGRAVWEKALFFLVAALSAVVTIVSTSRTASITPPGGQTLAQLPLRTCYLLMFYLGKMLWPVRLSSVYLLPEPMSLGRPIVLAAVLGTGALAAVCVLSLRRTRAPAAGGLFFLLAISPTLGLIGYSWVAASDKYVYLPAVGLLIALTGLLLRIQEGAARPGARRLPAVAAAAGVLLLAGLEIAATRSYLACWQDTETLYQRMVSFTPQVASLHCDLGGALARKGRNREAIAEYQQAIQLDPALEMAHYNLAIALAEQGQTDEAISEYREAVRLDPQFQKAHYNLAIALAGQGRDEEAIEHFAASLELRPDDADALNNLALVLARRGRTDEAVGHLREAVRVQPDDAELRYNLGNLLAEQGRLDEAVGCYAEALRLDPRSPRIHTNLGNALFRQNKADDAIRHYTEALAADPAFLAARVNLGNVLRAQGRIGEAIAAYREAARTHPEDAAAPFLLGVTLQEQGRLDEAVEQYRRVLQLQPGHAAARQRLAAATAARSSTTRP